MSVLGGRVSHFIFFLIGHPGSGKEEEMDELDGWVCLFSVFWGFRDRERVEGGGEQINKFNWAKNKEWGLGVGRG